MGLGEFPPEKLPGRRAIELRATAHAAVDFRRGKPGAEMVGKIPTSSGRDARRANCRCGSGSLQLHAGEHGSLSRRGWIRSLVLAMPIGRRLEFAPSQSRLAQTQVD